MGQTLSHGVYLPAEGERNCYSGLASNWQILNTAVGDIAEKAPLVHTHGNISSDGKVGTTANLPLITGTGGAVQAGSFGTSANTFCEGNDSRLSDARTPVAHTHTKSDVTDLLNSNFIPSANNSYDLGSSSYQWNNAYIKSLTINGVACGDILTHNVSECVNVSSNQTIGGIKTFSSNVIIQGSKKVTCNLDNSFIELDGGTTWGKGGSIVLSGQDRSSYANSVLIVSKSDTNTDILQYQNGELKPLSNNNNNSSLGTSTNKWKTLNGVNPGALSLPKTDASVTAINTSGFSFNGSSERIPDTVNLFSNGEALVDGWLCARLAEGAGHYIFLNSDDNTGRSGICSSCFSSGIVTTLSFGINVYVPIKVGDKPAIRWAKPNGGNAQLVFYPCLGNV